jgi:hypothetical protein
MNDERRSVVGWTVVSIGSLKLLTKKLAAQIRVARDVESALNVVELEGRQLAEVRPRDGPAVAEAQILPG